MNHTTRNAPFGTDDTPSMTVKIVGSKRVQIAVDSSKNQGSRTRIDDILNAGPTGTPAILTQPDWEAYDAPTPNISGIGQSDRTRKVSSYTSPNGDRSYSFKHGLPTHNPRVLLPPYTSKSTDPFLPTRGNTTKVYGNSEATSLASQIDVRDPSMINYEKILQYFSDCIADGPIMKFDSHHDDRGQRLTNLPQTSVTNNNRPASDRNSRTDQSKSSQFDDEKLIELILAQLATNEVLELKGLKSSLQDFDRSGTSILSTDVIQSTCMTNHLPLPMSLLLKLLRRAETSAGKANWVRFLEPLERANEVKLHDVRPVKKQENGGISSVSDLEKQPVSMSRNGRSSLVSDSGPSLVSSWKQKILERPSQSAFSEMSRARSEFGAYSGLPSPPSTTSTVERELTQLPDGWDEKERFKDVSSTPVKVDTFSDKMKKLEEMLRLYNPSNKDVLLTNDAERITRNFNLIYKLGLSEKEIADALSRSVLPDDGKSSENMLSVSKLLTRLSGDRKNSS